MPDLAEQLDHPAPLRQVGLGVDDHAAAKVDEPGIRAAQAILLGQDSEAAVLTCCSLMALCSLWGRAALCAG
jgi:hypothetical protein